MAYDYHIRRVKAVSNGRECIDDKLAEWIGKQYVFFVATAPMARDGHVNCSPKGGDSFRVLGPMEVAYQDYTGSGAETIAHLRENARIVIMFCAFEGKPQILRLHGSARVVTEADPDFTALSVKFPPALGFRSVIHVHVSRVASSCGFAVPEMEFRSKRDLLDKWAIAKGETGLREYRKTKNTSSIDGLPALSD